MALDILHDNWGPYTHTEVENALKAYLTVLENRINQAIQSGGVGLADLSAEVQALLNKANTALQPENISAWAKAQNKPGYTVSEITYNNLLTLAQKLAAMDAAIQQAAASGAVEPDGAMSDSSENAVQNKIVKAYIDAVSLRLDTLIGSNNVQGVIDTFNEVKAFLNGINTSDPTLYNTLQTLNTSITNLQTALDGKQATLTFDNAPTSGSNNPVKSGGVYTALAEKANAADVYNKGTIDNMFEQHEAGGTVIIGNGDVALVEGPDYIDLVIYQPTIEVSPALIALNGESAQNKQATLTVNGSHLKADIVVSVPTGFYVGATGTATQVTLQQSGGVVTNQEVVIRHNGQNENTDITGVNITLTSGTLEKTVPLSYTRYAGPTIIPASSSPIAFKTGAGSELSATLGVSGVNLAAGISATLGGTNADKFEIVSGGSISQSNGVASGNVVVKYKPSAGDSGSHTATLTLSSTNATSVQITLNGDVSTLSIKDNVSSLSMNTDQGSSTTDTFKFSGTNLRENVTIQVSGTGFSVNKNSVTPTDGAVSEEEVTVTFAPTASGAHSGTITISSSGASVQIALSGSAVAAIALDSNGRFVKDGIYYGAIEDTENGGWKNEVKVYNSKYSSAADTAASKYSGVLNIPSTVSALKNGTPTTFSVTKIDDYAFRGNADITSITLPDSLTGSLPANMLLNCTGLTYINTGNGVTALGYYFASGCSALVEVVCGDSLTTLNANNAWLNLSALRKVTIGSSVSAIGSLFSYNHATLVETIICRGTTTRPVVNSETAFDISNASNITVYIPDGVQVKADYIAMIDPKGNVISGISDGKLWKYFDDNNRLKSISEYPSNSK